MLPALFLTALMTTAPAAPAPVLVLENSSVRVEVRQSHGAWQERYFAKAGGRSHLLLASGHVLRPDPSVRADGRLFEDGYTDASVDQTADGSRTLVLRTAHDGMQLAKRIRLYGRASMLRIDVACSLTAAMEISHILSTYAFVPEGATDGAHCFPDFVFTPQLRPLDSDVIGDHVFRAPAFMLQRAGCFAALIPDLEAINARNRRIRSAADVRVDSAFAPMLAYGLLPWTTRNHVYYRHTDSMTVVLRDTTVRYGYFLCLRADAPARQGYREVVRFLWESEGRPSLEASAGPQSLPFSAYVRKAWYEYVPSVALDTEYHGIPVTLLRQARLAWSNTLPPAADNDAWFNVWFNSLRTAYGMSLGGRQTGDGRLMAQAERVLNLALAAPVTNGLAPSIFYVDSSGGHWVADQAWGGIRNGECYSMFHNAWTCYWLLQWTDLLPARSGEIFRFTRRVADFLVAQQRGTGVIPSWYDPSTLTAVPELRDDNAESAGAALFLAELSRRTGEKRYRDSAVRAMEYVFRDVLPGNRWFDYETFFSCTRKPLGFYDHYTHQYPQNTLSMHQAAEACGLLYEITGEARFLRHGEAILDYLCLYQQVWSPRWLSCPLFGGFGVQNTDGEWSDSRQAYFGITLMKYYGLTGRREYLERAVAAVRAQFSLFESPTSFRTAENYAHSAIDRLAGVTGLHWGTGSAVVSVELLTQQYGDAYVDVAGAWAIGIDGCTCASVATDRTTIRLRLTDEVHSPRSLRLVCGNTAQRRYRLMVNGTDYGVQPAAALHHGIQVSIP